MLIKAELESSVIRFNVWTWFVATTNDMIAALIFWSVLFIRLFIRNLNVLEFVFEIVPKL